MTNPIDFLKDQTANATRLAHKSLLVTLGFYSKAFELSVNTFEDTTSKANDAIDTLAENGEKVEEKIRSTYSELTKSTKEAIESRIEEIRDKLNLKKEEAANEDTVEEVEVKKAASK